MKPCILVVDDNPDVRAMLKEALAGDYHVVEASDGIFGLSEVMAGEQHIALIITDLMMPEVNGVDFVKNLPEDIPTIVLSGFLDIPEFQEALERFHPVAVLKKPVGLSVLREAVEKGLGKQAYQS